MTDTLITDDAISDEAYVNYALDFYKSAAEEVLSFDHPKAYLRLQKLTSDASYQLFTLIDTSDDVESILETGPEDDCLCVSLIFSRDPENYMDGVLVCRMILVDL